MVSAFYDSKASKTSRLTQIRKSIKSPGEILRSTDGPVKRPQKEFIHRVYVPVSQEDYSDKLEKTKKRLRQINEEEKLKKSKRKIVFLKDEVKDPYIELKTKKIHDIVSKIEDEYLANLLDDKMDLYRSSKSTGNVKNLQYLSNQYNINLGRLNNIKGVNLKTELVPSKVSNLISELEALYI
jgi:NADH dehydrogenase/NADH:ubiquinone oxidoreductase subunit G